MTNRSGAGFTIVEIIVTMAVLVILTTLVVVRLSSTQAGGRDSEREIDIETIATGLETYYENGNAFTSTPKGHYPGATEVENAANTDPPFNEFLDGVSKISYEAPDRSITDSFGVDPNYATSSVGENSDGSYSDDQARPLLVSFPYLYQPLKRDNSFCVSYVDCVKFNLYYLEEATDTVVKVRSKNQ